MSHFNCIRKSLKKNLQIRNINLLMNNGVNQIKFIDWG